MEEKQTDWFWPIAVLLTGGALIYMVKNMQSGSEKSSPAQIWSEPKK